MKLTRFLQSEKEKIADPKNVETTAKPNVQAPEGKPQVQSTALFRAINFELYVKPNMGVMILGVAAFSLCSGYIAYMNYKNRKENCYMAMNEDGTLSKRQKVSKWD